MNLKPRRRSVHSTFTTVTLTLLMSGAPGANASTETLPKVLTETVMMKDIHREILFPGRVSSAVQTEIFADGDGVVTRIHRNVGSPLKRQDTLLMIQNTDPVYRYAPLKVVTPVAGVLSTLAVTEGTQVKRGQLLGTVTDPRRLRVQIEVPALDLPEVRLGMIATLESSALPEPVELKIVGVSPAINPLTGTAPAELVPTNQKAISALRPGLIGQTRLLTSKRRGFLIPENAVTFREGKPILKVFEKDVAKFRSVKLGEKIRGEVEILEGLQEKDRLILRANRFVGDGQKVLAEAQAKPETDPKPEAAGK